ncbi:LysR family transcriptional regulator [Martelella sp. HB161492]|uniref:LysR family transcriptional regulator n=1 Tax=Martelella sp. HB161492 TaxID=2720726 RepID=UPI00158FD5ED|nr:LysR family transcriptional regulator [Martelella sp. HB161492]
MLAKFVLACQNLRISEAAAGQGLRASTLSTALKTLETRIGMSLFSRQGGHLGLLPSAFWLYRDACHILQLEHQARNYAGRTADQPLEKLVIDIDLSFAIGRLSKAVDRAIHDMGIIAPQTLIDCRFADVRSHHSDAEVGLYERIPRERTAQIDIFSYPEIEMSDYAFAEVLYSDPWVSVSASPGDAPPNLVTDRLAVTRMRPALANAIARYVELNGLGNQLRVIDADPHDLGQLLTENPHLRFLLPASILSARMGLHQVAATPLSPPLISHVGTRISGALSGRARTFLGLVKENLAAPEDNIVFEPDTTMRQIQLFNLACRSGGISAAARVANLSQPSVSAQLQKLEESVGSALFTRRSDGSSISDAGDRLLPFTLEIEAREAAMHRLSRDIAAHTQAIVSVGTLPSSGHDSVLTARVAEMATRIHDLNPHWRLEISEASNTALNERVRSGTLNLAIVGMAGPKVGRIALGPSEPLSVIANPAINLGDGPTLTLEAVCRLPLVMGSRHLSIHQTVMAAVRARHLRLQPAVEVGSLPLAIAMARRAPLCTVLPASSVRRDVAEGRLKTMPIAAEDISGQLSVIFSMDRALSTAERAIIQALIASFAELQTEQDRPGHDGSLLESD